MSPNNALANFGCLDELVQVIYQGMDKFVVLSAVSDSDWTIHLGLSGSEGRWWRGSWREADILAVVGSSSSSTLLEAFAEKLAESIVQGELHVEQGDRYKLTLGPTSKKPMHVNLKEMSAVDAAAYATDIFVGIALQAQSRQSHLTSTPAASRVPATPKLAGGKGKGKAEPSENNQSVKAAKPEPSESKAQDEIKALKAELVKQKRRHASPEAAPTITKAAAVAPRPLKGASLANPNKKARKYKAIEFESDEE
ncbi:hypothetical protein C8J57DRAFT_1283612 [Mycena rebaudengoi]|nr:hypothetical protein C8J57DRAFT_1283612 [Mycena rebaudengoi]